MNLKKEILKMKLSLVAEPDMATASNCCGGLIIVVFTFDNDDHVLGKDDNFTVC